jgi:hypothetical protein
MRRKTADLIAEVPHDNCDACPPSDPAHQVLDIASVTLFLMTMDCGYFGLPDDHMGVNQEFPDVRE